MTNLIFQDAVNEALIAAQNAVGQTGTVPATRRPGIWWTGDPDFVRDYGRPVQDS